MEIEKLNTKMELLNASIAKKQKKHRSITHALAEGCVGFNRVIKSKIYILTLHNIEVCFFRLLNALKPY